MKAWIILLGFLAQNIAAATLDEIRERGYIKIGVRDKLKGFGFFNQKEWQGLEVDIGRGLAEALFQDKNKVEFIPCNGSSRIPTLKNGEVDVLLAYFINNEHRSKYIDFGEPYVRTYFGMVQHGNDDIQNDAFFKHKKIAVLDSGSADVYFRKIYPDIHPERCHSFKECADWFEQGKVDAWLNDLTVMNLLAPQLLPSKPKIQRVHHHEYEEFIAPSVDKGNKALLQFVNQEIQAMKQDGRLKQYFNQSVLPHLTIYQAEELLKLD